MKRLTLQTGIRWRRVIIIAVTVVAISAAALLYPFMPSLSGEAEALLLILSVIAVAGLFFWLARYIWRLQDVTWFGRLGAILFAFLGCACLLAAFILGSCAANPSHIGG